MNHAIAIVSETRQSHLRAGMMGSGAGVSLANGKWQMANGKWQKS
jgi:thiamine phosphate synthase YjbQ (UPF0047 family)